MSRPPAPRSNCLNPPGFTLVETLVSLFVLSILVLLLTQLFNAATEVAGWNAKHLKADEQARTLFDRMSVDFAGILKRTDADYYLKSPAAPQTGPANDHLAFYSEVPGYSTNRSSPASLVAYRINSGASGTRIGMERLGKGLYWNADPAGQSIKFLPLTIASLWPSAVSDAPDDDYEMLAPQVFRFEYYYILKGFTPATGAPQMPVASITPWDVRIPNHDSVNGLRDVAAIVMTIAVLDGDSRKIVPEASLEGLIARLEDFSPSMAPGELALRWQNTLNEEDIGIPRKAASAIRIYSRHFIINPGT
jgi:prepilin-type N-terminal cleavage/methylation domain-containing protein